MTLLAAIPYSSGFQIDGFMAGLSALARERGALVVADEIFTGMGRCGAQYASERVGLEPDLLCLGKALGGGLPLSPSTSGSRSSGIFSPAFPPPRCFRAPRPPPPSPPEKPLFPLCFPGGIVIIYMEGG